jgi:hypothetical protein
MKNAPESLPGAAKVANIVKLLGYTLLILGGVLMVSGRGRVRAAGERTEFPIKLQSGQEYRAPIKTSAKSELVIELKLSRNAGVADNLIDEIFTRETNVLNIGWVVTANGMTNFTGSSTNARKYFTGGAADRAKGIGNFRPGQPGEYGLAATIYSDLPELDRAHPRIIVRPHNAFAMNASLGGSMGIFGGAVLALVGLILVLLGRREQKTATPGSLKIVQSS